MSTKNGEKKEPKSGIIKKGNGNVIINPIINKIKTRFKKDLIAIILK
jgi:hypothetical protein